MEEKKSRWGVITAFSLVAAATQMIWLTFTPLTTVAAQRYGVSATAIGWLANVFVLVFVVLAIPSGFLVSRHLRGGLLLGAVITAAGACLRLAGDSFSWMLIGGLVAALGQPLVLTGIIGIARGYLRPGHRPAGIAAATASTWAGYVAAFMLSAFFSKAGSLPALVAVDAAFAVIAAVALTFALRGPIPFAGPQARDITRSSLAAVRSAWGNPVIRKLCVFAFIPFGTFIALTTWTQALLDPAGVSVGQVGIILTICVLAGVAGTVVIPVLAARRHKEIRTGVAGIVVTAAGCVVLALVPGFGTALVSLALAGLLLLPVLAIILELVERTSGDADGVTAGLVWTMGTLGGLVITGVVGFTLNSPTVSFLILAAVALLGLPLLARLRHPVANMAPADVQAESAAPAEPAASRVAASRARA
ncbi:MAG TPA: MFS transporter [Streptosporangiaceae bacterium]|nr:MFS transporter [Streptosporangiaceae bacterium]